MIIIKLDISYETNNSKKRTGDQQSGKVVEILLFIATGPSCWSGDRVGFVITNNGDSIGVVVVAVVFLFLILIIEFIEFVNNC